MIAILIVGVVCVVILATTGQRIQDEREVLASIDAAGTRLILIADTGGRAGIDPSAVDRLAALGSTEWVIGLGPSQDGENTALRGMGERVSVRSLHGDLPPQLVTTWDGASGSAMAGTEALEALALRSPAGSAQVGSVRQVSITADFEGRSPLDELGRTVLRAPDDDDTELRTIYLMARHADDVSRLATSARHLLGADDGTQVGIDTSDALIAARAEVQSDLGRQARQAAILVLSVGLVLSGANVLGMVILRQRDFGRRRVLGASRSDVVALVALQSAGLALVGATLGTVVGTALIYRWTGAFPTISFLASVAALATLTATMASLLPAGLAALRDPVRALRVP